MRSLVWLLTVCIHSVYLEEISHQHEEHIVEVTALRPPLAPDKSTPHREAQHNGARPVTGAATLGNNGAAFDPLNMEKQILHLLAEDKGKCQNHPFQREGGGLSRTFRMVQILSTNNQGKANIFLQL